MVLAVELPNLKRRSAAAARANAAGKSDRTADDQWGAFGTLAGVVSIRSGVYFGLQSFAPLWLIHTYGASEASGNAALAGMLFAGALGTLVGGRLVDRIGRRTRARRLDRRPDPAAARRSCSRPAASWRASCSPASAS